MGDKIMEVECVPSRWFRYKLSRNSNFSIQPIYLMKNSWNWCIKHSREIRPGACIAKLFPKLSPPSTRKFPIFLVVRCCMTILSRSWVGKLVSGEGANCSFQSKRSSETRGKSNSICSSSEAEFCLKWKFSPIPYLFLCSFIGPNLVPFIY